MKILTSAVLFGNLLRGCNKKWTGRSNTKFSVNIGPTETYYIPNQWKLNENFAELCRFEIAALIG